MVSTLLVQMHILSMFLLYRDCRHYYDIQTVDLTMVPHMFNSNIGQKKPNGLSNLNKKVLIFLRSLDSPDSLEIPRDSLEIL